jgi:hypothetical protein
MPFSQGLLGSCPHRGAVVAREAMRREKKKKFNFFFLDIVSYLESNKPHYHGLYILINV